MRLRTLSITAAAVFSMAALATPAWAADDATVYVLHGVPEATVDVYVNGKATLTNFKPGTLTDGLKLPAGEYDLKVTAAGAGADAKAVIQADDVKVPAGANVTVVAHLNADGSPVLTPFVNDVSKLADGQGRLTVRHVAAAPAVDVRAGGKVVFPSLVNPKEAKADLAAGTVQADVALAGTDTVAIGPADVAVKSGVNTIVYAWGSAQDKNLKLAVQTLPVNSDRGVSAKTGVDEDGFGLLPLAGVTVIAGAIALRAARGRSRQTN